MSDTRTNRNESVIPRMPSNRRFIVQMLAWGWKQKKSGGRYITMLAPMESKETVEVQPPHKHDANATSTFLKVYQLTTQGDAELFWRGPNDLWLEMIKDYEAREAKRKAENMVISSTLERPVIDGTVHAAPAPPPQVRAPEPSEEPVAPPDGPKKRGRTPGGVVAYLRTADLLAVMEVNRTLDTDQLCRRAGLDPNDLSQRRAVSNLLSTLTRAGKTRRMSVGKYRLVDDGVPRPAPLPTTLSPASSTLAHETIETPPATATIIHNSVINNSAKPAEETVDDVIEAVLDLLLPNGFKAQDLRVIQPWIEATKKMVGTVAK